MAIVQELYLDRSRLIEDRQQIGRDAKTIDLLLFQPELRGIAPNTGTAQLLRNIGEVFHRTDTGPSMETVGGRLVSSPCLCPNYPEDLLRAANDIAYQLNQLVGSTPGLDDQRTNLLRAQSACRLLALGGPVYTTDSPEKTDFLSLTRAIIQGIQEMSPSDSPFDPQLTLITKKDDAMKYIERWAEMYHGSPVARLLDDLKKS